MNNLSALEEQIQKELGELEEIQELLNEYQQNESKGEKRKSKPHTTYSNISNIASNIAKAKKPRTPTKRSIKQIEKTPNSRKTTKMHPREDITEKKENKRPVTPKSPQYKSPYIRPRRSRTPLKDKNLDIGNKQILLEFKDPKILENGPTNRVNTRLKTPAKAIAKTPRRTTPKPKITPSIKKSHQNSLIPLSKVSSSDSSFTAPQGALLANPTSNFSSPVKSLASRGSCGGSRMLDSSYKFEVSCCRQGEPGPLNSASKTRSPESPAYERSIKKIDDFLLKISVLSNTVDLPKTPGNARFEPVGMQDFDGLCKRFRDARKKDMDLSERVELMMVEQENKLLMKEIIKKSNEYAGLKEEMKFTKVNTNQKRDKYFDARNKEWEKKRRLKVEQERIEKEIIEGEECTFAPKIRKWNGDKLKQYPQEVLNSGFMKRGLVEYYERMDRARSRLQEEEMNKSKEIPRNRSKSRTWRYPQGRSKNKIRSKSKTRKDDELQRIQERLRATLLND